MKIIKRSIPVFYLCLAMSIPSSNLIAQPAVWDSIKEHAAPVIAAPFATTYAAPQIVPLQDYGWEDGLQVSYDGLNLYALYAPADLLSWVSFFVSNPGLPICSTLGSGAFIRPYAGDYGMDMQTNIFGCDTMMNLDILYAHRNTTDDAFENWILSDIARPGFIEGGPFPLFSAGEDDLVDHFLFTSASDIWMINNTSANPNDIASAVRLPTTINPVTNEFTADNPMLTRLDDGSLLLIYEKYTDPAMRDFMYSISDDDGITWSVPVAMTSINNDGGHIEHPMLYFDGHQYWMYYSQNLDIWRAKQDVENDWDSWVDHEAVILKGNTTGIGEPSITADGDIFFVAVYQNTTNPNDVMDADPWFAKNLIPDVITENDIHEIIISPNPASSNCSITCNKNDSYSICIVNLTGLQIKQESFTGDHFDMNITSLPKGAYFITITDDAGNRNTSKLMVR